MNGRLGYARMSVDGNARWGMVRDDEFVTWPGSSPAALARLPAGELPAGCSLERHAVGNLAWALPVEPTSRVICVGVNFAAHGAELGRARSAHPSLFLRSPSSLVPHATPVVAPRISSEFDYEGEIALVIGRRVERGSEPDLASALLGYTCFGDHSVRDFQRHTAQVTAGKNFDASGSCGPWIAPHALVPEHELRLRTLVNGEKRQAAQLADLLFPPAALLRYITQFMCLEPGDVIATGTPDGVGWARDPPCFLRPGDTVRIELGSVMALENTVTTEQ